MQTQIHIEDYDLTATASKGWAKVGLFGQLVNSEYIGRIVEFNFTQHDAIVAGIELGHIPQPDSTDDLNHRISYENPAFSATVREVLGYEKTTQHQDYVSVLRKFSGTQFAEDIVRRLALQAPAVREVIQAEAARIALSECPVGMVEAWEIERWFENCRKAFSILWKPYIDFNAISDYIKQSYYAAEQETLDSL